MPTVPHIDSFQVNPNTSPSTAFRLGDMPDAGAQAKQMGQALGQVADTAARIQIDMQQQANQLRRDDALNQFKEEALRLTHDKDVGYTNIKGINALQRPDGKPLADEYSDTLKSRMDEISSGLGNDAQRREFTQAATGMLTSFRGNVLQHEAGEFKTYSYSVSEGIQSTALRDIELNYNNPEAIDKAVGRIQAETYRQAQLLGKSAEWTEATARKQTSNAHKTALLTALEQNDPSYADSYLKKYSGQMDADDILSVRGHITREMDNRIGVAASSDVMTRMQPRIQTSEAARAFNIALGTESGGKQFDANGQPLTSPKGAIGIAQVMPGTAPEAAKLAGIPWDESRYKTDPEYNKALGFAYFQQQLQTFGGDPAKAYAAYNAGPAKLQEALKKADKWAKLAENDPKITAGTWLDYMPAETKNYVTKNMAAYNAGQGNSPRATFEEVDNALRADPRLANNPARYKAARADAVNRFEEQTKAIKQKDDDAVAEAMRGVMQNGGRYSDLPASVRSSIPPKEVDNVLGFAQKIAKGDDTTSLWLYNKLTGNPDSLRAMSDNEFFALRRELSESDFKHFSNERAKLTGATSGSNGPGDLNTPAIKQTLDERLRMLKIDPTPKDDGGNDAARVGGIRRFVDQYFMAAQRESGKKFSDAEVSQHIDALFAKNATMRGLFTDSSGPALKMNIGDIDSTTKTNIKAAFKRQGVDDPTDAQILNAYWNMKVSRK